MVSVPFKFFWEDSCPKRWSISFLFIFLHTLLTEWYVVICSHITAKGHVQNNCCPLATIVHEEPGECWMKHSNLVKWVPGVLKCFKVFLFHIMNGSFSLTGFSGFYFMLTDTRDDILFVNVALTFTNMTAVIPWFRLVLPIQIFDLLHVVEENIRLLV